MLQTIREHTQGWIAGIIISIIILSFALWGIHSYFVGGTNNLTVAEVNGIEITKEQLSVAYQRLRHQVQIQYGATNPLNTRDEEALKERSLRSLIEIEVLKQASTSQHYLVSNYQIDNYLESMPEFQVDGRFSVDRFQELLSSTMLSTSEFLELIRTSLLIDQPKLGIIFTSFALPIETNYTISLVNQERDIDYINIPLQYFLAQPIAISADQIKAYYANHKNEFMTPEQVSVDYIELSLKDLTAKMLPTDTMLKNFYNENINSYTEPMSWKLMSIEIPIQPSTPEGMKAAQNKAESVLEHLNKGEDFSKFAKMYPGTIAAQNSITLNQIPVDLQKEVANLTKPGQLSGVIQTNHSFVILKALSISEPKIQTFEAVKNKVKDAYIRQHAEEKLAELRDQLADVTYEHPDSLQLAAKNFNLPIKTSESFSRDKGGNDISQYKKIRDVAFSNDVLNLQNNSDVISLNPETLVVLRIKSHVASTLLPLSSVTKQIEDKLKTESAKNRATQFTNELVKKLQSGANPDTLAAGYKFNWIKAGFIGRYSTKVDSAILDTAFRLPNLNADYNKTIANIPIYTTTQLPNGYAIVALKAVKPGNVDQKQQAVFAEQVQNSEGLLEYELYKQSQTYKAKVKIEQ